MKIYQIAISLLQAFSNYLVHLVYNVSGSRKTPAKVDKSKLTVGANEHSSKLRDFKAAGALWRCKAGYSVIERKAGAQKVLKGFISLCCYKNSYRVFLTYLFLVLVSMFSLSAQTPRKDSGADGSKRVGALQIGDTIPQLLWEMPLSVINRPKGKQTISLSDYKSKKLIVLDFWNTWCGSCITGIKHGEQLQGATNADIEIFPVTEQRSDEIKNFMSRNEILKNSKLNIVTDASTIAQYFPHTLVPHIVFIKNNKVVHIGGFESMTANNVRHILKGQVGELLYVKNDSAVQKPLLTSMDTLPKTMYSMLSGYRKDVPPSRYNEVDTLNSTNRIAFFNYSVKELLEYAFSIQSLPLNTIDLTGSGLSLKDIAYHNSMGDKIEWLSKNAICYEQKVLLRAPDKEKKDNVLHDISKYLRIDISFAPAKMEIYEIILKKKPNPGNGKNSRYISLHYLLDAYNRLPNSMPIVDKDGISGDIYVPKQNLSRLNSGQLIALIKEAGCQLVPSTMTINTIQIKDR
ncbi:TlpA family protein disulfide reductase [Sphingobacterium prati]|uniref:TlpA family protein disulfide reductase n=1 Tax=Sphingobacterium prati TaxID=2737006 RepID=UPI001554A44E|nr:redoxin domain-containing protein [Sphingobacterium prati]NPE48463.1 redoxin domain-containing protein [Sphingobacterium prati]